MTWLALILGGALAAALQEIRIRGRNHKITKLTTEVHDGKRQNIALQRHLDTATVELERTMRKCDRQLEQSELERTFLQGLVDGVPDSEYGRAMLRRRRERLSLPLDAAGADNTGGD